MAGQILRGCACPAGSGSQPNNPPSAAGPATADSFASAARTWRIAATRWPSKELVDDRSQGVQLATIQELARYWTTDYDFGRVEARLNALPQFVTEIDGVDIHFIHVKSSHENARSTI
jgi:Epoxide hydrolase N terminus